MFINQRRSDQTPHLICPRCGKSTIVLHGDSTYVCLDHQCGFRHDVSSGSGGGSMIAGFFSTVFLGLLALIIL